MADQYTNPFERLNTGADSDTFREIAAETSADCSDKAWNGKPAWIGVKFGRDQIDFQGSVIEPHYEMFGPTTDIRLNGRPLYVRDAMNTRAYHNDAYTASVFRTSQEAIDFLAERYAGKTPDTNVDKPAERVGDGDLLRWENRGLEANRVNRATMNGTMPDPADTAAKRILSEAVAEVEAEDPMLKSIAAEAKADVFLPSRAAKNIGFVPGRTEPENQPEY